MKAAIYCRISSDQTGEAAGVTRQLEDCRALVEQLGWPAAEEFTDNDISAASGKVRPQYQRLLAAMDAGEVEALVTWAPDRLYRKLQDLEPLIVIMERHGVTLKTVRGGEFDMGTPLGRMIARILASVATGEGEVKADRWKRSIRQRREAGQIPKSGPRLFGYTRDGDLEPTEALIVEWLAESAIEGESLNTLAAKLNSMDVTTTLGNEWGRTSVRQLLTNGRLAGWSLLNGDRVGVGQWDAILSEETFEQVQAALAVRRRQAGRRPRVSLLIGLVKCSECGAGLVTGRRGKRGDAEPVRIYKCRREPGGQGCGGVSIQAAPVEEIAEAYAKARLADPRVREHLAALSAATGDKTGEVIGLEQRLVELEAQLDEPGVPVATIMRAMDRTRERIETLRAEVALAPQSIPMKGEWPEDLGRRARLVQLAVESVVVRPASRGGNALDVTRISITPRGV